MRLGRALDSKSACAFVHLSPYLFHHVVEVPLILLVWFIGITALFLEECIAFGVFPALVELFSDTIRYCVIWQSANLLSELG